MRKLIIPLLLATALLPAAAAQPIPRHPPVLAATPVEPVAAVLADPGDLAYVAMVAWNQTARVVELTGATQSQLAALEAALEDAYKALRRGDLDTAGEYLRLARTLLLSLTPPDTQSLAMDNPAGFPACKVEGEIVYYVIASPWEEPGSQAYCPDPIYTVPSGSALDTILALLGAGNITRERSIYWLYFVHVPREAAYPDVVAAVLEGGLGESLLNRLTGGSQGPYNASLVETLLQIVREGSQEEALDALQTLLQLAREGKIPYSVYAEALSIYQSRFGAPPQLGEEQEEVELNLTELASQMEEIVRAAEKARAEVQAGGGPGGERILPEAPSITPPPAGVLVAGIAGLAVVAAASALRSRSGPLVLPRLLAARPPSGGEVEWCYRALVAVLSMRGLDKEPWETPREYLERLRGSASPEVVQLAELLTEAYEAEVYGGERAALDAALCARSLRGLMAPWRRVRGG